MRSVTIQPSCCPTCAWTPIANGAADGVDLVGIGLWPVKASSMHFFDFSFLFYISVLQHHSPELSMGSMLKTFNFIASVTDQVS